MAKGTVNKVILLGRLGQKPEVRQTQNGTTVASLGLATNDGMGENITTEWHRVVVFGKGAEAIRKYADKGTQLFVEGRLRTNKWQDKNGNTQYTTEIICNNFQFVGGSNNESSNKNNAFSEKSNIPSSDELNSSEFSDDIPF